MNISIVDEKSFFTIILAYPLFKGEFKGGTVSSQQWAAGPSYWTVSSCLNLSCKGGLHSMRCKGNVVLSVLLELSSGMLVWFMTTLCNNAGVLLPSTRHPVSRNNFCNGLQAIFHWKDSNSFLLHTLAIARSRKRHLESRVCCNHQYQAYTEFI
jgi:hypothetical protein